MHPLLIGLWAKRKVIVLYGLLFSSGWLLNESVIELTVVDTFSKSGPKFNSLIMVAMIVFIVLSAIPFVPGAEVGFGLLLLFGAKVALLVYFGMVCALVFSYLMARLVPPSVLARSLTWLGLNRAADLVWKLDSGNQNDRLRISSQGIPSKIGPILLRHRYAVLAVALNTPGNSILGGGGGLAFAAGASRLFPFWHFLTLIICAVAPVPFFFLLA